MPECEAEKIQKDLKLDQVFATAPAIANVFSFHQLQFVGQKVKGFTISQDGNDYFEKYCK